MPKMDVWRTYTGGQASQIHSGLQVLLDGGVLGEKEQEMARRIQGRLGSAMRGAGEATIPFSDDESDLLYQVEAALWK